MRRAFWVCSGVVIGAAQVTSAGDGAEESAAVSAPLGSISLNLPASGGSRAAIGEGGPRDNWGVYVRGAGLLTGYTDADLDTTPLDGNDRSVDFDSGLGVSAAVGYRFWNFSSSDSGGMGFRIEGEITYERAGANDVTDGLSKLELVGYALNGYFDLALAPQWTWYLGAGVGVADARGSGGGVGRMDDPLFAQVMSGFGYTWGGPLSVYGGLRVRGYEDMESSGGDAKLDGFASGSVELGVMLSF